MIKANARINIENQLVGNIGNKEQNLFQRRNIL